MTPGLPLINLMDFEASAKELLPSAVYDYIAGGATDEFSVARNRRAFESWALRPRVLRDVSSVDLTTTVLGERIDLPVMMAPCGGHNKAHELGELATLGAAGAAGTIMVVSANSSTPFRTLAASASAPLWLQMYPFRDRGMTRQWLDAAKESGYRAICVTLDSKWRPKRERDLRNKYRPPVGADFLPDEAAQSAPRTSESGVTSDPAATWHDLEWIVGQTSLPVVAKGVMTPEDVVLSVQSGVKAVIISNHGGRQLDGTLATVEVLPGAVEAADDQVEVLVDGGIRRGTDVVKALALGARAVLIGRPLFWGLAVDGEQGVSRVLDILREEIETTMAKCGMTTVGELDASAIVRSPSLG